MFEGQHTVTPKLLANIKRIAVLTEKLNTRSVPRVVRLALRERAAALSTYASTRIEGNPLPLTEVKRILKARPKSLRDSEREVVNYNAALEALDLMQGERAADISLQKILHIHETVMAGLQDPYFCGRLRAEPVVVHNPGTGETIYLPPDHQDVARLMTELVAFVNAKRGELDPLILAGLFHKQFVVIHPFTDGNGRTARLVTTLLLAAMGIDTLALFSFEDYYNRNISRYFERVGVRGNYYDEGDSIDFTAWLEYFTDGIIDEVLRVAEELQTSITTPETSLRAHHKAILRHIQKHGFIADRDYAEFSARARATRALDFKKLCQLGLIERRSGGRSTYYVKKDQGPLM